MTVRQQRASFLFAALMVQQLLAAPSTRKPGGPAGSWAPGTGARAFGPGISGGSVGNPANFTLEVLDENGELDLNTAKFSDRFVVYTSPPPYSGSVQDLKNGTFLVQLVHEWVTSTSPQHGLTNVTVLLDGKHIPGSPFVFGTDHQFAIRQKSGSEPLQPAISPSSRLNRKYKAAYATLVATEEFSLGAMVLGDSLRVAKSRYPLIAMLTSKVGEDTEKLLQHAGIITKRVEPVSNPYAAFKSHLEEKAWEQVYTKVQAWSLVDYDRVVFMDADQLVKQNIDSLFDEPMPHRFAAVPDVAPPIFFNSGFMMLEPSMDTVGDMMQKMHVLPSYDDGDQGFLNAYFKQNWDRLPYIYNFMKSKTGNPEAFYWLLDHQWWSIKVFHMVGVKPWKCSRFRDCGGFPERVIPRLWALWWDSFLYMCETNPAIECIDPMSVS